ncbi:uncharacterized protein V6R79_022008 [Siganus canaliculatus]
MAVSDSVQKSSNQAASVLRGLNLQRQRAQYCDCVVRHGQDQGQLYPAHKCILAASSPVLASILSSAGALVELHTPCLSDSVLALVLDYMYTGALPYTCSQQQYHSLLTAAHYLQMDELQKTLRTEMNPDDDTTSSSGAENQLYPDINSTYSTVVTMSACSRKTSFEREDNCSKETCGSSSKRIMLTPECLIQNRPRSAEMSRLSGKDKEVQKDQFHSAATVKPESWHESTKEALEGTAKNSRSSFSLQEMGRAEKMQRLRSTVQSKPEEKQSNQKKLFNSSLLSHSASNLQENTSPLWFTTSSSPTSPHLFCGAVPVIRHSSTANMAEVPPYHQSSEVSFNSNRSVDLQSGSSGNGTIAEGIIRKHKSPYGAHNQDYRCNKDQLEAQSGDGSDHHGVQDQSDVQKHDASSSTADLPEHMGSDLSHITGANTANFRDIPTSATKDCSSLTSGIKDKTGWSFDDATPTHQKMECSHFHHVSKANPAKGQCFNLQNLRAVDPLSAQPSSPGLDCYCEDVCDTGSPEKISPISEPEPAFTMPMDNDVTDPAYGIVGQSYLGHLHYQCIPREDTHLSFRDIDRKQSPPSHQDHAEQSGDDDEEGTFASPGLSPLRRHFAATDKVLLLDISTKPAELLVSYRHGSDLNEKWHPFAENSEELHHDATNFAGFDKRQIGAKNTFGAENIDEANTRVAEIKNAAGKKSNGKENPRPGAEVIHKAGGAESENKTTTLTVRSPPNVPDSVQATVSSSLSICIPSTLSASKPTDISPRLSAPVHHPFQCSLCERSFSQRGSLNRHVRSHLGVRPFPCPRCPMTFSRQYRVSEHMRVHQRCSLVNEFHKPPASSV